MASERDQSAAYIEANRLDTVPVEPINSTFCKVSLCDFQSPCGSDNVVEGNVLVEHLKDDSRVHDLSSSERVHGTPCWPGGIVNHSGRNGTIDGHIGIWSTQRGVPSKTARCRASDRGIDDGNPNHLVRIRSTRPGSAAYLRRSADRARSATLAARVGRTAWLTHSSRAASRTRSGSTGWWSDHVWCCILTRSTVRNDRSCPCAFGDARFGSSDLSDQARAALFTQRSFERLPTGTAFSVVAEVLIELIRCGDGSTCEQIITRTALDVVRASASNADHRSSQQPQRDSAHRNLLGAAEYTNEHCEGKQSVRQKDDRGC